MSPITVPVLSPTDMVTETATLALICVALWAWALSRVFTDAWRSLQALGISAPVAYYLLWLLTINLREPLRLAVSSEAFDRGLTDDDGQRHRRRSEPPWRPPVVPEVTGIAHRIGRGHQQQPPRVLRQRPESSNKALLDPSRQGPLRRRR